MTHFLIRGAIVGVIGGGLAACTTAPAYPITAGAEQVPAQPTPPPTVVSPPTSVEPPVQEATPHPSSEAVDSQPLAPVPAPKETPPATEPAPRPPVSEPARLRVEPTRYIAAGKVITARKMYRDYQVRKGDHLNAIARDLETTRAILTQANHLKNPDALIPGQHLKVPVEKAYVVQSGDTLAAVAKRFDVNVEDLADLNGMSEGARLHSGEELALPGVIHDGGPVALAALRPSSRFTASHGYQPSPWNSNVVVGRDANAGALHPPAPYPTAIAPPTPTLTDAQVTAAGRGRFVWPVRGDVLSSFGVKDVGRRNDGVDVKAAQGTPVHAAAAGDVVYAGDQVPGFGNLVLVKHADGWVTAYAHLDKVSVKMRESVTQGEEIGQVGQSGGVSEPQLHFEIRYAPTPVEKAKPIDPLLVLPE